MKRLLVIRLGALGDLIHASASFQAAKAAFPELELHLLTSPAYRELAAMLPGVDHVWGWDKRQGWQGLLATSADLRNQHFDGVINLHPSFKSWLITQLCQSPLRPIPKRVYHKQKLRVKGEAQRVIPRRHAMDDFYQPFRALLNLPDAPTQPPSLNVPPDKTPAKPDGERWVGIIPGVGAKRSNRAWNREHYQHLIGRLLALPNTRVLLIGGPDEKPLAEQLTQATFPTQALSSRVENHCGTHDIPGTAGLLAACDWVIGGDTGPMHLAAGVHAPIIAIYGPTALARTGPITSAHLQTILPPKSLACWPCEASECPLEGEEHLACMKEISVEQVWSACQQMLTLKRAPSASSNS